jgi:hypothetical protein
MVGKAFIQLQLKIFFFGAPVKIEVLTRLLGILKKIQALRQADKGQRHRTPSDHIPMGADEREQYRAKMWSAILAN